MQALVLGGAFEKPPVKRFLPGARKTILFPALLGRHGTIVPIGKGKRWEHLVSDSLERAALIMSTTDPLLVRDSRGVLQMAILNSDSPLLATGVLTKGFLNRFSAQFGPELIVAVPARNKVYVFPKLANRLPDASREIRDDYLISPMPVSTEFFELSKKGLKAAGTADPTDR